MEEVVNAIRDLEEGRAKTTASGVIPLQRMDKVEMIERSASLIKVE